jgi:cGMP-dependent protein kinase
VRVVEGTLEVIIDNVSKKQMKKGDSFGELALLFNAPRSATVKTLEECSFWAIERATFKKTMEEVITHEYEENRHFIDKVKFFGMRAGLRVF